MKLRIHVLQHVAFEGPAALGDWASLHGHSLSSTHYFAPGWKHPLLSAFDLLVVMGGPMGVHDTAQFSWLQPEMDFVKSALGAGKKVLGVCLGAQILAHVLGAQVFRNPEREIGWFPLQRSEGLSTELEAVIPPSFTAFHWHGETFSLPEGAQLLCTSSACVNQGFLWKQQALALQFHLETTDASAEALVAHASSDLAVGGKWVQTAEQIQQGSREYSAGLNRLLFQLLDRWSLS